MSMGDATIAALTATWQQLDGVYRRAGSPRTDKEIWKLLGATPMIGQNDIPGDVFTLGDAARLMQYARSVDLGRLSFWSTNRDVSCGAVVDDERASNTCSGVDQEPLEFARTFAGGPPRRSTDGADAADVSPADPGTGEAAGNTDTLTRDDPRTSPYPLWRSLKAYEEAAKVVWQGRVYQAKWWTQGDQPDAQVENVWDTPWRYLGPVLESDRVAVQAGQPVIHGNYAHWTGEKIYVAGDEVEHDEKIFRAKWWTQGDVPLEDPDQPYDHPWEYLGEAPPDPG